MKQKYELRERREKKKKQESNLLNGSTLQLQFSSTAVLCLQLFMTCEKETAHSVSLDCSETIRLDFSCVF